MVMDTVVYHCNYELMKAQEQLGCVCSGTGSRASCKALTKNECPVLNSA